MYKILVSILIYCLTIYYSHAFSQVITEDLINISSAQTSLKENNDPDAALTFLSRVSKEGMENNELYFYFSALSYEILEKYEEAISNYKAYLSKIGLNQEIINKISRLNIKLLQKQRQNKADSLKNAENSQLKLIQAEKALNLLAVKHTTDSLAVVAEKAAKLKSDSTANDKRLKKDIQRKIQDSWELRLMDRLTGKYRLNLQSDINRYIHFKTIEFRREHGQFGWLLIAYDLANPGEDVIYLLPAGMYYPDSASVQVEWKYTEQFGDCSGKSLSDTGTLTIYDDRIVLSGRIPDCYSSGIVKFLRGEKEFVKLIFYKYD